MTAMCQKGAKQSACPSMASRPDSTHVIAWHRFHGEPYASPRPQHQYGFRAMPDLSGREHLRLGKRGMPYVRIPRTQAGESSHMAIATAPSPEDRAADAMAQTARLIKESRDLLDHLYSNEGKETSPGEL